MDNSPIILTDIHKLASIIESLTSDKTDNQTRQNAEKIIINSVSDDLIRSFIELIKSDEFQEQTKNSSIVVFSNILKNLKLIKGIVNISPILSEIYSLSTHLILNSYCISTAHLSASLLVTCINSIITINQSKTNIELPFFQDLFYGICNSPSFYALHGFCFALCDLLFDYSILEYCNANQIIDFFNGIIFLLQNNYSLLESKKSRSDDNEHDYSFEICDEILNLNKTILDQDEICQFLKENTQLFMGFLQPIMNCLNLLDTFGTSMSCLSLIVEYNQKLLFPFLFQLIEIISNFISSNFIDYGNKFIYDSVFSICNFFYNLSKKNFFLYQDINIFSIITTLCKIISNIPPNCDFDYNWEPHNVAQLALSNIISQISQIVMHSKNIPKAITRENFEKSKARLNSIISDLISFASNLLSSPNYYDRSTSLIVYQSLIGNFHESIFFSVKQLIFQLVNDKVPRVREAAIDCLIEFVSSFPDNRCSNSEQFSTISEIFQVTKDHLNENSVDNFVNENDCFSISMATFNLFYNISLIPGFDFLSELVNLIFGNLPFLLSNHKNSILSKILEIIKEAHFGVIQSFPTIEQFFIFSLQKLNEIETNQNLSPPSNYLNFNFLIPSTIDIILEYCERFGKKLPISTDLIQYLINFALTVKPVQSSYSLPLIGFILSKLLCDHSIFDDAIQLLYQISISLLQTNSEFYTDQDLISFYQCSVHSIIFFKFMALGNLIPENLIEIILQLLLQFLIRDFSLDSLKHNLSEEEEEEVNEIKIPFDLQVYSINLALIIGQRIPQFWISNGELMLKSITSILNSYSFLKVGKFLRAKLFKIVLENLEIVFSVIPIQFLAENCPIIINNFVDMIITLKTQSVLNYQKVLKLFHYTACNFPIIVQNAINHQYDDFITLVECFSSNEVALNNLIRTTAILGYKL